MDRIIHIGLNHKTAPVEIRECLAFTEEDTRAVVVGLRNEACIDELMLISTCNRVEFVLATKAAPEETRAAIQAVKDYLVQAKQVSLDEFESALYIHQGEAAVRHLFRVAASLDSMVLGEPQILGQVKTAYRLATEENCAGVILNRLLHRTFFVAKRIRSETGIGGHAVSISYAAIELGRKIFGDLKAKKVLLIGAGEMAELAVEHLIRHRTGDLFVANRTFERGAALADKFNGTAIKMEEIPAYLAQVDIIISSTGATGYVLTPPDVKGVMRDRRKRPLFFIDIAVPRDIDPDINKINNAYLYDIDDLNEVIDDNLQDRQREAIKAERIIDEAVLQFKKWFQGLQVVPTIKAMRAKVSAAAHGELQKTLDQLNGISAKDQKAIERMMEATINKILHDPTSYLKREGCMGDRSMSLDVARKLFGLDKELK